MKYIIYCFSKMIFNLFEICSTSVFSLLKQLSNRFLQADNLCSFFSTTRVLSPPSPSICNFHSSVETKRADIATIKCINGADNIDIYIYIGKQMSYLHVTVFERGRLRINELTCRREMSLRRPDSLVSSFPCLSLKTGFASFSHLRVFIRPTTD